MTSAYNTIWLRNLTIVKEARQWMKEGVISPEQYRLISETYKSGFYHPNLMIRILLFIATLIALGGMTGLVGLMFAEIMEDAYAGLFLVYGVGSLLFLESVFIKRSHHYKSGVNEALLYHSLGFIIGAIAGFADFDSVTLTTVACFFVL